MCVYVCAWCLGRSEEAVRPRGACESLVSAENQARSFARAKNALKLLSHFSRPRVTFLAVTKCLGKKSNLKKACLGLKFEGVVHHGAEGMAEGV